MSHYHWLHCLAMGHGKCIRRKMGWLLLPLFFFWRSQGDDFKRRFTMGKVQSLWRQNTLCFFSLIVFALHSRLLIFTKNIHEILLVPSLLLLLVLMLCYAKSVFILSKMNIFLHWEIFLWRKHEDTFPGVFYRKKIIMRSRQGWNLGHLHRRWALYL